MARYLAERIIARTLGYSAVVAKRPDLKADIDNTLRERGCEFLIVEA